MTTVTGSEHFLERGIFMKKKYILAVAFCLLVPAYAVQAADNSSETSFQMSTESFENMDNSALGLNENGVTESETNISSETSSSNMASSLESSFNDMMASMNSNLPTLETESMESLRGQLTESMKENATLTLSSLFGTSFSGLNSKLFSISGMPDIDTEELNVQYASMREAFEKASLGISGSTGSVSSGDGQLSGNISGETSSSSMEERFNELRNSEEYKTVNGEISLANVFGSLETKLPSQN